MIQIFPVNSCFFDEWWRYWAFLYISIKIKIHTLFLSNLVFYSVVCAAIYRYLFTIKLNELQLSNHLSKYLHKTLRSSKLSFVFLLGINFFFAKMNRFEYVQAILRDDESFVAKHKNMKLYNGDQRVNKI